MTLHIVKHLKTGAILDVPERRGSTWWEPGSIEQGPPRIFKSKRAAISFISMWTKGRVTIKIQSNYDEWGRDDTQFMEWEDVGRKKSDLIAVPIEIKELT